MAAAKLLSQNKVSGKILKTSPKFKKNVCTVFENSPLKKAKKYIPSFNICVKKSCSHCTLKKIQNFLPF